MRRRHALELLVSFATLPSSACGGDSVPLPASASTKADADSAPPGPPAGLVAMFALRGAEAVFDALRGASSVALAGTGWSTLIVDRLGLPITCAQLVDERGTPRGVLVRREDREPELVVAIPLRDADRLIVFASGGEAAPFRRVRDEAGLDWLERKAEPKGALALSRTSLVWGASREAVRAAAAYLSRPDAALRALFEGPPGLAATGDGAILPALAARLGGAFAARAKPLAALAALAEGGAPSLDGLGRWTLAVELTGAALVARLHSEGGAELVAGLETGPVAALWPLAAEASVALLVHQGEAARNTAIAPERVAALAELSDEDRSELAAALRELAAARAARTLLAIEQGTLGLLAWGDVALHDRDRAQAALARVAKRFPIGEDAPFGLEATVLERIGDVFRGRIGPMDHRATMFARLEGQRLLLATGSDPVAALRRALPSDEPRKTLADVVPAALAAALGDLALAAVALDVALLGASGDAAKGRRFMLASLAPREAGLALTLACEPLAVAAIASLP